MKIVTIIGNRPQFIKTALVSKELRKTDTEILIHTGQHYDNNLSDIFFEELCIPMPDINLGISEINHGRQTGLMIQAIEDALIEESPDYIIVYGDTNSTLAGAIAGSKLHIPIAHIEAGLRSFNKKMPEEVNRILTDHVSTLLFCPNDDSIKNLNNEGIKEGIINCGDVMEEVFSLVYSNTEKSKGYSYAYMTLHRAENTDDELMLKNRIEQVGKLDIDIIWPIHPKTKKQIKKYKIDIPSKINIIKPQGYVKNLDYIRNSQFILTDSGGLQKESYWAGIPCYTLRTETEWLYTIENGWNTIILPDDNLAHKIDSSSNLTNKYVRQDNISESKLIVETIREVMKFSD